MTIREAAPPLQGLVASYPLATGQEGCERLLAVDGLPPAVELETRRRMVELAPALAEVAPSTRVRAVRAPLPGGWFARAPSIAARGDGLRLLAPAANWTTGPDQNQTIHDANGVMRTRWYGIELTADGLVCGMQGIDARAGGGEPGPLPLSLRDDYHLVHHAGAWWVTASRGNTGEDEAACILCRLDGSSLADAIPLRTRVNHDGGAWAPVVAAGDEPLRFLVSIFPTVVLRYDDAARAVRPETEQPTPLIARKLHPVSQAVPCQGGHLCLARETVAFGGEKTNAVQRWAWFDAAWTLRRLSRPFRLETPGQEGGQALVAGLAQLGEELVISYGDGERELWLASVALAEALSMLAPPLELDLGAFERQLERMPEVLTAPEPARASRRDARAPGAVSRPTIVSMTMSGNNRDDIADALRSVVDWVDWCLFIDTGITDDTLDIAREVAGEKLIVHRFRWRNDFSAARNFGLARAAETGADWAVTVDSDERLELNGLDIHAYLAETEEPCLLAPHESGSYTKDRFFRLPAGGEFRGPTHEAYYRTDVYGGAIVTAPGVVFKELEKSKERFRQKDERDRDILREWVKVVPDEARWHFYLGEALYRLDEFEEAAAAFRACSEIRTWDEEGAWSMYRVAQCLVALDRHEEALEAVARGLTRHAGLGDLYWYGAYLSLNLGRPEQAVYWARIAITLGYFEGSAEEIRRLGWNHPWGLWEGPYDVLRFALPQLGDDEGAREAERKFHEAAAARRARHRVD